MLAGLSTPLPSLAAVILAGGLGRRMGYQQKGLLSLNQRPLIEHMLDKIRPYTEHIMISANAAHEQYQAFGYPVVADLAPYQQRGPLAGIYSGITQLAEDIELIQILPCDSPYLPNNLAWLFYQYLESHPDKDLVVAATDDKVHPVIMQCRRRILQPLKTYLDDPAKQNRVMGFIRNCDYGTIQFSNHQQFTNINEPSLLAGYQV
ncbi:molybdenum cofactor guanylyltransferase [Oligella urethralis]|uniref:molybdenum cofactor guanylyltransferase MobA n=1 Tax=Oligella urethralis TaxID=90245 RepID=UPI000D001876|nr:molybdenum cofactor guanylyltransferase MobA [Oligella urethralis]AVL70964.1 molybdenum cofactor guanylyltransferase [Oligella urethralis]